MNPYAESSDAYWRAGWRGVLPLPPRKKKSPPSGFTGEGGIDPSYADVRAWADDREGAGNVALRMPRNVIGLDVDAYGDKIGALTLSLAEERWGVLPPTWRSTSRDDGVSGIRLYRVPEGLAWPGELGSATEIIQRHHRYAVVWPSIHPDTGNTYRWITPAGVVSTAVPDLDDLPLLPEPWVQGLTGGELAATTARGSADDSEAANWLATRVAPSASPCLRMQHVVDRMRQDLGGSAHAAGRDATARASRLAEEGHRGVVTALVAMREMFTAEVTRADRALLNKTRRTDKEAGREWQDLLTSAVNLITANPSGVDTCDCDGQITDAIVGQADDTVVDMPTPQPPSRLRDGASFILDAPTTVPAVWGWGDDVLWAEGESLMLVGPPGVGKTTLTGQVLRARLGLAESVLGFGVAPTDSRVLYLAMDRPSQIARSLRRTFVEADRPVLAERLRVWEGPPPGDVAKHPDVLVSLARLAEADTLIIDSVKDAAVGLTEDEVAAAYNRARQTALAAGVQVLELHHLVKRGPNGAKPTQLADVYGSAWLTAGAGSVVLLWGGGGSPLVEWHHLKQPAAQVGPMMVEHDHDHGVSSVWHATDLDAMLTAAGASGVTARQAACALFSTDEPDDAAVKRAARRLDGMVKNGVAVKVDAVKGGPAGTTPARWFDARRTNAETNAAPNAAPSRREANAATPDQRRQDGNPSRNPNAEANAANAAPDPTPLAPLLTAGGGDGAAVRDLGDTLIGTCADCGRPAVTSPCTACRRDTA